MKWGDVGTGAASLTHRWRTPVVRSLCRSPAEVAKRHWNVGKIWEATSREKEATNLQTSTTFYIWGKRVKVEVKWRQYLWVTGEAQCGFKGVIPKAQVWCPPSFQGSLYEIKPASFEKPFLCSSSYPLSHRSNSSQVLVWSFTVFCTCLSSSTSHHPSFKPCTEANSSVFSPTLSLAEYYQHLRS